MIASSWNFVEIKLIFSKTRRDAKDVLLAVMGQADTLARCIFPRILIVTSFYIWDHNHLYIWPFSLILTRCVNDCLRVSEEKEVVSDGAAVGSRFVDMTMIAPTMVWRCLNSRTVRLATPPSDKLLSLTSGINSNLTALLSLLQVCC